MKLPNPITWAAGLGKPKMGEEAELEGARYISLTNGWPAVTDDLLASKGNALATYRKMRHEPELKAALTILTGGLLGKGWEIHVAGDDDTEAAQEQSDFVTYVFNEMPGSLDDVIEELLNDALSLGTAISERVWALDTGDYPGKLVYKALKAKDPTTFSFDVDPYGNVTGLTTTVDGKIIVCTPEKFLVFRLRSEHSKPEGQSEFRGAYRWYWLKDKATQFWAVFLEKYGAPTAKGMYKRGTPKAAQAELLNVLDHIQQETAIVIPDDVTVEFMTVATEDISAGFKLLIAYCDEQMIKAVLGQTLTTGEGARVGSMALGQVHEDVQTLIINRLRRKVEEFVDEQIIRPLIDLNYPTRLYPNFALSLGDKDVASLADAMYKLVSCKLVDARETWTREYLGLPPKENLPELPPEPAPFMPPGLTEPQIKPIGGKIEPENTEEKPAPFGHDCFEHFAITGKDALTSVGAGEQPNDPRIARAIQGYYKDCRAAGQALRSAVWRALRLPELTTGMSRDKRLRFDAAERIIWGEPDQATFDRAVEVFLEQMAGRDRTRLGFVAAQTGDGIIQQWNTYVHAIGSSQVAELTGAPAVEASLAREGPEVTAMLTNCFDRLSEGGQLRLESSLGELRGMVESAVARDLNPVDLAREMSERFDAYEGWEFLRLARTETSFAQVEGELNELRAEGVDASGVEDDPPPWHP